MSQHLMIFIVGQFAVFVDIGILEGFRVVSVDFLELLKRHFTVLVGIHDPETDMTLFLCCRAEGGCSGEQNHGYAYRSEFFQHWPPFLSHQQIQRKKTGGHYRPPPDGFPLILHFARCHGKSISAAYLQSVIMTIGFYRPVSADCRL
jgi:hypothetical protein